MEERTKRETQSVVREGNSLCCMHKHTAEPRGQGARLSISHSPASCIIQGGYSIGTC